MYDEREDKYNRDIIIGNDNDIGKYYNDDGQNYDDGNNNSNENYDKSNSDDADDKDTMVVTMMIITKMRVII